MIAAARVGIRASCVSDPMSRRRGLAESAGRGFRQRDAPGHDRLPPTIVDVVPIDEIDLVWEVAVAERLGQSGDLIERQPPAGVDG